MGLIELIGRDDGASSHGYFILLVVVNLGYWIRILSFIFVPNQFELCRSSAITAIASEIVKQHIFLP